jgi:hypothetical protein
MRIRAKFREGNPFCFLQVGKIIILKLMSEEEIERGNLNSIEAQAFVKMVMDTCVPLYFIN